MCRLHREIYAFTAMKTRTKSSRTDSTNSPSSTSCSCDHTLVLHTSKHAFAYLFVWHMIALSIAACVASVGVKRTNECCNYSSTAHTLAHAIDIHLCKHCSTRTAVYSVVSSSASAAFARSICLELGEERNEAAHKAHLFVLRDLRELWHVQEQRVVLSTDKPLTCSCQPIQKRAHRHSHRKQASKLLSYVWAVVAGALLRLDPLERVEVDVVADVAPWVNRDARVRVLRLEHPKQLVERQRRLECIVIVCADHFVACDPAALVRDAEVREVVPEALERKLRRLGCHTKVQEDARAVRLLRDASSTQHTSEWGDH